MTQKITRRNLFKLIDRDCVSPQTADMIKQYIDQLHESHTPQKQVTHHTRNNMRAK